MDTYAKPQIYSQTILCLSHKHVAVEKHNFRLEVRQTVQLNFNGNKEKQSMIAHWAITRHLNSFQTRGTERNL
jgi:hypothetical protein